MEVCEHCKKRRKRYRVAFGSWICDYCKIETQNYQDKTSGKAIMIDEWWRDLNLETKETIWKEHTNNTPPKNLNDFNLNIKETNNSPF